MFKPLEIRRRHNVNLKQQRGLNEYVKVATTKIKRSWLDNEHERNKNNEANNRDYRTWKNKTETKTHNRGSR